MNKIIVEKYVEHNLIATNNGIATYSSGEGEILSGGPPPLTDKYVDLSKTESGNGGNSTVTAYTAAEWIAYLPSASTTRFFMTGSYSHAGALNLAPSSFTTYQGFTNTPWRLRCDTASSGAVMMADGILDTFMGMGRAPLTINRAKNMYIICGDCTQSFGGQIYGSTISCGTFTAADNLDCKDSTINASNGFSGGVSGDTFTNCAISGFSPDYNMVASQVNVTFPTMPSFASVQSDFQTSTLFANVDTPPQPGNPPYDFPTNPFFSNNSYNTDLWGNARNGIGTGLMASAAVAPNWVSNPTITAVSGDLGRIYCSIDADGTVYAVLVPRGATAPSPVQVKAGQDSSGSTTNNASANFTNNVLSYFNIPASADTQYDCYCVAEGSLLQASVYGPLAYDSPRMFSGTVYVDLSLTTTGTGTEEDPYTGSDFLAMLPYSTTATLLCKGSMTTSENITVNSLVALSAWNLVENGPWRIKGTGTLTLSIGTDIRDGIIDADSLTVSSGSNMYNMYIITPTFFSSGMRYYGCMFRCDTGFNFSGNPFYDCVIMTNNLFGGGAQVRNSAVYFTINNSGGNTFTNCTVSSTASTASTWVNCSTGWLGVTLPPWDTSIENFNTNDFLSNIPTPPQPGTPPYTNYTTDFWGNPRTSIGTGNMAVLTPEWIATYPKVHKITYTTAQFLARINRAGIAYAVVLPFGSTAPTSAQVKAGTDANDIPVHVGRAIYVLLSEDVESAMTASNLSYGSFDVYLVAESASIQDVPVKISIEVPRLEPVNPAKPGPSYCGVTLAGPGNADLILPKVRSLFRGIAIPNMLR